MRVSVIVRSRDEAERLRLTLTSLALQTVAAEVILVNDGSLDRTLEVVAEAADWLPLRVVDHATPRGRSGAANAGARAASGDILLFVDGDNVANPDLIARHLAVHSTDDALVGRGETFHLRGTRFLQNPELGIPWPGEEARLGRLSPGERSRLRVTRDEIINRFEAFDRRAEAGIYPGTAPRRLYELEMDALIHHPGCTVLWAAACGSNLSIRKDEFLRVGGFDERLDMNEHRELAFRLCLAGGRMVAVPGARTYHLTHRVGWRDPLSETAWERVFYRAHPVPAVKLLSVFWASMCGPSRIPGEAQIKSLLELEAAARGDTRVDYDAARRFIPALPVLDGGPTSAKFAHSEQQDRL